MKQGGNLDALISGILPEIIALRHKLHQIPELKFEEFKTSTLIEETLKNFGYSATKMAKTGIVVTIDSGKPGKTVALRADIDALPIKEETHVKYQSQHENRMHACGHDGHTATLLLAAFLLSKTTEQFCGKIKLIFQPAEEGGKGSIAMINEGVLKDPNVDAIFGYHNWPGLSLGKIGTRQGPILLGNGRIEITIHGKVAHTSMPQNAVNPVTIGALIITAMEKIRENYQPEGAIINTLRFESGEMKGGMTDTAKILSIYYVEDDDIFEEIKTDIQHQIQTIARENNAKMQINFLEFHKPTVNTKYETELVFETAKEFLPNEDIINFSSCQIAAEDFSEYLRCVPGCFFLVGSGENSPPVHTSKFDFPDEIIPIAAKILCKTAINFLKRVK